MQYPISYDIPAKTFSRMALGLALTLLGGFGVVYNIFNNPLSNPSGSSISVVLLVLGSGILWGIANPQQIRLTETELQLPKTIFAGNARNIPYEDVIGVSLILHKWGRTAIIMSVGHKMAVSTHLMGHARMFDMIDQIHAHAPHLGKPPVGTLRGLFRAGQTAMPS